MAEAIDIGGLRLLNATAADTLFYDAGNVLNTGSRIALVRLTNLGEPFDEDRPSAVAPLALIVPQQVGNRFAQLGLAVAQPEPTAPQPGMSLRLANPADTVIDAGPRAAGQTYLEGDYIHLRDQVYVTLRLVDGRDNRLLSSTEYVFELTSDLFPLLDPSEAGGMFGTRWMR